MSEQPRESYHTRIEWSVKDAKRESYLFTSEDRWAAEDWMIHLASKRPDLVLVHREVRTESKTWFGSDVVEPWHTPCEWISSAEDGVVVPETTHCFAHDHAEGEPVPAEHIRGAS